MRTKLPWLLVAAVLLVLWIAWRGASGDSAVPAPDVVEADHRAPDAAFAEDDVRTSSAPAIVEAARESVSDARDDETAQAPNHTHRVTGRVVDEARFPVAGARITLGTFDTPLAEAITADDGGFELFAHHVPRDRYLTTVIRADTTGGRSKLQSIYLLRTTDTEPVEVDAGVLALAPSHELSVRVLRTGTPIPHASVEVRVGHARLLLGTRETDAAGELQLEALPTGAVHLSARHASSVGALHITVPEHIRVEIQLEAELVAEFEVVDAETGEAVVGAEIDLFESSSSPASLPSELPKYFDDEAWATRLIRDSAAATDIDGYAKLHGLLSGVRYSYGVRAAGYATLPPDRTQQPRLLVGEERNRAALQPTSGRRVAWPIVAGDRPIPADGTPLVLRPLPGVTPPGDEVLLPANARVQDGQVLAERVIGPCHLLAQAPDGSLARLFANADAATGTETRFVAARRIEVRVHDARGAPVVGQTIIAVDQGHNDLCEPVRTGADGVAVLEGLMQVLATVGIRPENQRLGPGETIGTVDLEQGDGRLAVTWSPPVRSRARLEFLIDGSPRLPGQFQVTGRCAPLVVEEFPASGQLAIEFEPPSDGSAAEVFVRTALYQTAKVELHAPADGSEARAIVELSRACVLCVRLERTGDERIEVAPQRFDEERGRWVGLFHRGRSYPNGPGDSFLFKTTGPGRWRVVEEKTGETSQEIVIAAGDAFREVELELAAREWVSGRVEVADLAQLDLVRVALQEGGETPAYVDAYSLSPPPGVPLQDGAFRIQVPSDEEVSLVTVHPWLVQESGPLREHGGRDGVVLRLVEGDGILMPVPQLTPRVHSTRIARFAGGMDTGGKPIAWHQAAQADGDLRCSLPSGTWTLLIDPGSDFAPVVVPDVVIDGTTHLPAAQFERGSSVRVKLITAPGSDPPRIVIRAVQIGDLSLHRQMNSRGEAAPTLHGLGPGRHKISYGAIFGEVETQPDVELDGANDVEFELDLR